MDPSQDWNVSFESSAQKVGFWFVEGRQGVLEMTTVALEKTTARAAQAPEGEKAKSHSSPNSAQFSQDYGLSS